MNSSQKKNEQISLISWAFYDWANSAYSAIIETFVFAAYFVNNVAADKNEGAVLWGVAIGISGFAVALGGPILGAITDQGGNRKQWLLFFSTICILCVALMWFVKPTPSYTLLGLVLIGIAATASEYAYIFYNAMLPELAAQEYIGRWSGWGWALGYAGGVVSMILCLVFFFGGLSHDLGPPQALAIRSTFLLAAVWYAVFSLPLFLLTPRDARKSSKSFLTVTFDAFKQLHHSIIQVRAYGTIYHFLIARMIFTDALITLFAFGGVYAATVFHMDAREVLMFGIALNISAGGGAYLFGFLDDKLGSKRTIMLSLISLIITGTFVLVVQSVEMFWIGGISLGIFVGPAQASSRSYLARMAPAELRHQMFGLFALSAKATAFLGPLCVSWITFWSGSLRVGMSTIIMMLLIGLLFMTTVKRDL